MRQLSALIGGCECGGVHRLLKADPAIDMHSHCIRLHACTGLVASLTMPVTVQPSSFIPTGTQKTMCHFNWICCCRKSLAREDLPPTYDDDISEVVPKELTSVWSAFPAILSGDKDEDCDDGSSDTSGDTEISDFIRGYPSGHKEDI
ncbi:unnamed protein product [Hydatigera taeniaeformis]|uniref:Uncharacterized protein n=1 Tax=Hydatigena taeniaeformis TaxID=6205 RepID=A0A0R3WNN8_HYDTA|nr:unnamed protein product [Hydatigera taeniaeformis]